MTKQCGDFYGLCMKRHFMIFKKRFCSFNKHGAEGTFYTLMCSAMVVTRACCTAQRRNLRLSQNQFHGALASSTLLLNCGQSTVR